jgi:hypothetical protein
MRLCQLNRVVAKATDAEWDKPGPALWFVFLPAG